MRDPARIHEVCEALEAAWRKHPDQRLGQLLENYVFPAVAATLPGRADMVSACLPFWQEDDVTLEKLKELMR